MVGLVIASPARDGSTFLLYSERTDSVGTIFIANKQMEEYLASARKLKAHVRTAYSIDRGLNIQFQASERWRDGSPGQQGLSNTRYRILRMDLWFAGGLLSMS